MTADYLVLSAAIRPHPVSREIARVFKLPFDADGFFMEAHLKLRPLDFASSGIFLCGLAHGPKFLEESLAQAKGAAARALGVLAQQEMYVAGAVAQVDPLQVRRLPDLCAHLPLRGSQDGRKRRGGGHRPGVLPGLRQLRQRLPPEGHCGEAQPGRAIYCQNWRHRLALGPRSA